jgi:hypothetical protein
VGLFLLLLVYHVRALKDLKSPSVIIKIVEDVHAVSEDYVEVLQSAFKKVKRFSGSVEDSDLVSGSFSISSIPFQPSEIGVSSTNSSFEGSGRNTTLSDTFDSSDEDYVEVLDSASRKVKRFSSFIDLTNA